MVDRITPEQAYEEQQRGDAIIVDSRSGSWDRSDVKAQGAYRIPPSEVEEHINELPKDKEIITYCT